jgi:ankyrin repeat protein
VRRSRSLDAIEALLMCGAQANSTTANGWTPLHEAAFGGNLAAINILVSVGAHVDVGDCDGTTWACARARARAYTHVWVPRAERRAVRRVQVSPLCTGRAWRATLRARSACCAAVPACRARARPACSRCTPRAARYGDTAARSRAADDAPRTAHRAPRRATRRSLRCCSSTAPT